MITQKTNPIGKTTSGATLAIQGGVPVMARPTSTDGITLAEAESLFSALGHTHQIADVAGLQAILTAKQAGSASLSQLSALTGPGYAKLNGTWGIQTTIPTSDISGLAAIATSGSASDIGSGTLSAARLPDLSGTYLPVGGTAANALKLGGQLPSYYALASAIPLASTTTPAALGASGAVGTGTTWARADHVHIYPTAAQVGAEAALGNPGTSGYVLSSTTGGARSWVASVTSLAWSAITSKPTTLSGYGITDAQSALGFTPVNKAGDTGVGMLQVNYTSTTSSTRGILIGSIGNYLSGSSASLAIGIPTAATNWPLEIQKNGVTIFSVDTTGTMGFGIVPVARVTGLSGWATKTYTNGSTTDVAEGTSLYFTSARAIAAATPSAIGALALAGGTMNSGASISFANVTTGTGPGIQGTVGDNDFWRYAGGATATNSGYAEIATADDGTEPIYVRQYTGVFATLVRTATLLDGSGNTSFPGTVTAPNITVGTATGLATLTSGVVGSTTTLPYQSTISIPYTQVTGLATVATSGSASDLGSGILGTGRMPGLTGDVTSSAGGVATTLAKIQGVTVATLTSNGVLQYVGGSIAWTAVPSGPVWSQVGVLGGIGYGSAGQVMLSAGASTAPVWTNPTHSIISDWSTATSGFVTGGPYQPLSSNLTALAASVAISSSAGAANFFSDVASGDAVMRWGSPYTETVRLGVMSNSSGNNASSLWFSASSAGTNYSFTATGIVRSSNGNYGNTAPLLQVGDNQYGISSSGGALYLHQPNGSAFQARRGGNTYSIWDSGNLNPGNYLPLVGGTLTGGLTGTTATMSGVICSGYSSGSNANLVGNWNSGGYYGIGGTGILNDYTILLQGVSNLGVATGSANLKVTGTITSVAAANAVGLQINAAYGSGQIRSWNFSNIAAQVLGIGPSTDPSLIMLTGTLGPGSNAIYLQGFVNANSLVAGNLSLNGPLAIASAGTGCLAVPYGSTTNAPTPVEGQILLVQGGPGSGPVSTYLAVPSGVTWTIKYRTSTGATAWVGAGGTIDFPHLSGFLIGGADGNWHLIHV